jgi:N-acetylneuraminate synthase
MVILHCVSGYPAPPDQYNLKTISDMADRFQVITGLSDHTICNTTAIASVAMGACVIEKHVTLDRDGGGADDSFSIEPSELKELCRNTEIAWTAVGEPNYKQTNAEKSNAKFRRSIYVVNDIEKGEILTHKNIRSIRPGFGIEPKYFQKVLGAEAKSSIARGTPLSFDLLNLNDFEKD